MPLRTSIVIFITYVASLLGSSFSSVPDILKIKKCLDKVFCITIPFAHKLQSLGIHESGMLKKHLVAGLTVIIVSRVEVLNFRGMSDGVMMNCFAGIVDQ